jgi:hypothetical protein
MQSGQKNKTINSTMKSKLHLQSLAAIFFLIVSLGVVLTLTFAAVSGFAADANPPANDWVTLWQRSDVAMPVPVTVRVGAGELGGLGEDLENCDWQMVSTGHHQLYFQPSADRAKVAELYRLLDRVYVFLSGRNPAKPSTPIKAFLVPNERGHSRCSQSVSAMRTGEQGELPFLLTSLLHEETHLFNFAFLGRKPQNWWCGEFSCIYFQERARLDAEHRDLRKELSSRLPKGPIGPLAELDRHGKDAFDEAVAAMFFLEETYGCARFNDFRCQCLASAKASNGGKLPESIFKQVFGKDSTTLDKEWRAFFGWPEIRVAAKPASTDPRLETKVSYATEKASVQDIVRSLAEQAGLQYDFQKSLAQTDPVCRRWVEGVAIRDKSCRDALEEILGPVGLRYQVENGTIVLYRK